MEPHIDGNEGQGGLLRDSRFGSAGHLRVRRLRRHCLPQNELLQVRGESNCFPQKGCTGSDKTCIVWGGVAAQYGKVVEEVVGRDLLRR